MRWEVRSDSRTPPGRCRRSTRMSPLGRQPPPERRAQTRRSIPGERTMGPAFTPIGRGTTVRDCNGSSARTRNPRNYPVDPEMMDALQRFNKCIGDDKDIVITGGRRPRGSNLGAGNNSQHVVGSAADIYVPGQSHRTTASQAVGSGLFPGVGWYEEGFRQQGMGPHVHVDLRDNPATWGYDRNGKYYSPLPPAPGDMGGPKPKCD